MRQVCNRLPASEALAKLGLKPINRERASVVEQRTALAAAVASFLSARAAGIADQLVELLGLEKARRRAGGDPEALADAAVRARKALDALEFDEDWHALISVAEEPLAAMASDGALAGLQQIGVKAEDVQVLAGDKAAAWGRARAAEMVGMKRNAAGELVPNASAKWRIDDSTREMLRTAVEKALTEGQSADELKAAILEDRAFSAERAEAIARTEIRKADMAGTMESYRASGLVAGKTWSTSQDDEVSDECRECEAQGVIGLDEAFANGEDAAPGHPNCRCTVLPVLDDEMPAGKNLKDTNMTKLFAAIEKADKQDDGTLKVYGYLSAEVVDSDGETVTADAMRAARDGYMAFANVREMHDAKKAAGVAIEYEVQDDGRTWFGAHVVDPVAVLKVETGVYKGFSIGAKVPAGGRDGKVIKAIDLREVSLVDRPANPEAVFVLAKAEAEAGVVDAESNGGTTAVNKSAYNLQTLITAVQALRDVCSSADWERMYGEHSAEMVTVLGEALRSVAAVAQQYMGEEMALMLRGVADGKAACAIAADVLKAGKRFSAATKGALKAVHDACKAADKALVDLGYDKDDEDEDDQGAGGEQKADAAADLQKRATEEESEQVAEIAKAIGLMLAEPTAAALTKAALTELVTLRKSHADLLASPAAPKGATKTVTLDKATDRTGEAAASQPVVKADGAIDDVATLIKAAQARPIRVA